MKILAKNAVKPSQLESPEGKNRQTGLTLFLATKHHVGGRGGKENGFKWVILKLLFELSLIGQIQSFSENAGTMMDTQSNFSAFI